MSTPKATKKEFEKAIARVVIPEDKQAMESDLARLPKDAPYKDRLDIVSKYLPALTVPDELLSLLTELNGQDAYDSTAFAIGVLKTNEYLRLPESYARVRVPEVMVGTAKTTEDFPSEMFAKIYFLNKRSAPDPVMASKFALVRTMALVNGWLDGQNEVTYEADPPMKDVVELMVSDEEEITSELKNAKEISFVLPFLAEIVFRTTGHHYLTAQNNDYLSKYRKLFASCLMPDASEYLPPAQLFHAVLHWVSPKRVRSVLLAKLMNAPETLPDAISLRSNAAPAGTALVTTTNAVLLSMGSAGITAELKTHGKFDIDLITSTHAMITANPCAFHKAYFAYGVAKADEGQLATLEGAKQEAIKLAPYTQGYITAMFASAALGAAKALHKHANENPVQLKKAQSFFKTLARGKVSTIAELFVSKPTEEE